MSKSKYVRMVPAVLVSVLASLFVAAPSHASQTVSHYSAGQTFETTATAAGATGVTTSNNLERLVFPGQGRGQIFTYSIVIQASLSNAVVDAAANNFTCWFGNTNTQDFEEEVGGFSITVSSITSTSVTCDLTATGIKSGSTGEFRFGISNNSGDYGRVGYAFTTASSSSSGSSNGSAPAPVYYGGPALKSVSFAKSPLGVSDVLRFQGKRLDRVTSATIGGIATTLIKSRDSLEVYVPESLSAGIYDLVLQTSHGSLRIMKIVAVK